MKTSLSTRVCALMAFLAILSFAPISNAAQATVSATQNNKSNSARHKIDLNTATREQLETLPGVGAATADAIIAARPFSSVQDLKNVQGIGDVKFGELRSQVTVSRTKTNPSDATARSSTSTDKSDRSNHTSAQSRSAKTKVDLNTADRETLQTLPGIGATTADAIIAARPFKSVDDLKAVKGIGDTRYQQLRSKVTVGTSTKTSSGTAPSGVRGTSSQTTTPTELGNGADKKARGETATPRRSTATDQAQGKIDINTASKQDLESLLGIGPVKAQAIIDNRPYKQVEDVMNVKGIKEGTFNEIKDRITVR